MAYSNNIITDPVSISDVQAAVAHSSGDLATLITEGEINKWARFKPISVAYIPRLIYSQIANAKFGLTPAENTTLVMKSDSSVSGASIVASKAELETVLNANKDWNYTKPSGGSSSPYRLTDFYAPADRDPGWGYCSTTDQPLSGIGSWGLKLSDIISVRDDIGINHTSGSAVYNWKLNDPHSYPVYSTLRFRFGDSSYDNINGADVRAILLNELLGVTNNENWRLVIAVQVPVGGSLSFMRMFASRYTFIDTQAIHSSEEAKYILPALSTNQQLCYFIAEYANYLYNLNGTDVLGNIKLTQSHPTFILPACVCLVKDMYLDTVTRSIGSGTWERCRLNNVSKVYSPPASASRFNIVVTDNYHWSDSETEAYELVTISVEPNGQYAQFGEETWKRHPINELRLKQNTASTKTIYYRIVYIYITGYNGNTPITTTRTITGNVTLSNSISSFVNLFLAAGPSLQIIPNDCVLSTSPLT